jgi:hypothetical protein
MLDTPSSTKNCKRGRSLKSSAIYTNIEYSITLCYQWFWRVERFAPPNAALGTPQQLLAGGVVGVVLHEAARAIFDMENIPRLGSEDDAADQLTAFVGLQFSRDVAQAVIKGTYWVWANYDLAIRQRNEAYNFAGRASVPPQRMLNTACIAYGADPATFKDFASLLSGRANNCAAEYQQVQYAFDKTIKALRPGRADEKSPVNELAHASGLEVVCPAGASRSMLRALLPGKIIQIRRAARHRKAPAKWGAPPRSAALSAMFGSAWLRTWGCPFAIRRARRCRQTVVRARRRAEAKR